MQSYFLAFILSFCSLYYELSIAAYLKDLMQQVVLTQSFTIAFFLLGGGLGLFYNQYKKFIKSDLFYVEICLAFSASLSLPYLDILHIHFWNEGLNSSFILGQKNSFMFLFLCQIPPLIIGFLSGVELGILEKWNRDKRLGYILFSYYIGQMIAGIVFGILVLQGINHHHFVLGLAWINFAIGFIVFKPDIGRSRKFIVLMCFVLISFLPNTKNFRLKNYYYNDLKIASVNQNISIMEPLSLKELFHYLNNLPPVRRIKTPFQIIDIVDRSEYSRAYLGKESSFRMYLDGHFQFDTVSQNAYHSILAFAGSAIYQNSPKRVLILGGGDGLLLKKLRNLYDDITLVELDSEVYKVSKSLFKWNDHGVKIYFKDAFQFLRNVSEPYDAIYIDLPYPKSIDLLKLYSVEFYTLVARSLRKNGFFIADFPLPKNIDEIDRSVDLFASAGFSQLIALTGPIDSFVVGRTFVSDLSGLDRRLRHLPISSAVVYSHASSKASGNSILRPSADLLHANQKSFH